ncbi:hypothetical protein GCM10010495_45770 [Kitasatospora herbaricolor]|nr:hypothetical protein GCM10010495_45770 [Kitasatospora herbaricolor]
MNRRAAARRRGAGPAPGVGGRSEPVSRYWSVCVVAMASLTACFPTGGPYLARGPRSLGPADGLVSSCGPVYRK